MATRTETAKASFAKAQKTYEIPFGIYEAISTENAAELLHLAEGYEAENLASLNLTWHRSERSMSLLLHVEPHQDIGGVGSGLRDTVIGRYPVSNIWGSYLEDDSYQKLKSDGNRIYYALRRQYPTLKRDLRRR